MLPQANPDLSDSDSDGYEAKREAREYIRSYLQVENESTLIKDKVQNRRDWKYGKSSKHEDLFEIPGKPSLRQR